MPQLNSGSAFARALNRILSDDRFTAEEMAEVAECSARHIYNVRNGDAQLSHEKAERLSRWLCRHGETRLATAFICAEFALVRRAEGKADGAIQDELIQIIEAMGDASRAHEARNAPDMEKAVQTIRVQLTNLEAELGQIA